MDKTKEYKLVLCSICGELLNPKDRIIIEGLNGAICEKCVSESMELINIHIDPFDDLRSLDNYFNQESKPVDIHEELNDYVIGQDYAKQVLSVAVYNHYKSLHYKTMDLQPVELDKSNVMLVGPTGSGKTHLIKTLARSLEVPYAIADACTLTESGYVGTDVEDVLRQLIDDADGDISLAEEGIVYIDEIDKLTRKGQNPSTTKDVGGEGVQQALLKMIEGSIVEVPAKAGQRRNPTQETISIDTSNVLFIFGGSFEGIEEIIRKRLAGKSAIGFGSDVKSTKAADYNDYILQVNNEDLRTFGLIPEFVGRIPIICPLNKLTEEELCDILVKPRNSLVKQYTQLLKLDDVTLEFKPAAVKAIAAKAIKEETGARGLRAIIEKTMLPHMYSIPSQECLNKVIITGESITEGADPDFIYKPEVDRDAVLFKETDITAEQ